MDNSLPKYAEMSAKVASVLDSTSPTADTKALGLGMVYTWSSVLTLRSDSVPSSSIAQFFNLPSTTFLISFCLSGAPLQPLTTRYCGLCPLGQASRIFPTHHPHPHICPESIHSPHESIHSPQGSVLNLP